MSTLKWFAGLVVVGKLAACSADDIVNDLPKDDGIVCTELAAAGLNITVVDAVTKQPLCDATVVATEGEHTETLMVNPPTGDCQYAGAYERAGTYSLDATSPGHLAATLVDVTVTKDECHVIGVMKTISLTPAP